MHHFALIVALMAMQTASAPTSSTSFYTPGAFTISKVVSNDPDYKVFELCPKSDACTAPLSATCYYNSGWPAHQKYKLDFMKAAAPYTLPMVEDKLAAEHAQQYGEQAKTMENRVCSVIKDKPVQRLSRFLSKNKIIKDAVMPYMKQVVDMLLDLHKRGIALSLASSTSLEYLVIQDGVIRLAEFRYACYMNGTDATKPRVCKSMVHGGINPGNGSDPSLDDTYHLGHLMYQSFGNVNGDMLAMNDELFRDLYTKMLEEDPAKRIKLEQVPNHPWWKRGTGN